MRFASGTFDLVMPASPISSLPARLRIAPEQGRTAATLCIIVPAIVLLSIPAAVSLMILHRLGPVTLLTESTITALALMACPILWLAFTVTALQGVLPRIGRRRLVRLGPTHVKVVESSILGRRAWREPISAFRGVAHNVRATMAGTNHELVLVHPDKRRSVLLHAAPSIDQACLDHYSRLLGLGQVPAREIYRLSPVAEAKPQVAMAA